LGRFRDGEVVGGQARLTFEKGETARFAISSDVADEIHVHGYDVYKDVPAGGTARFAFRADMVCFTCLGLYLLSAANS